MAFAGLAASALGFAISAWVDPSLVQSAPAGALPEGEASEVLLTLARYQQIYEDFFARGGKPELLDEFPASKELRHQAFRDVGFLRDVGLFQVQDLARAILVETRWTGRDEVQASVYEEWNHVFQGLDDRSPRSTVKGAGQGFRYRLRRGGAGWIVVAWDPVPMEAPDRGEVLSW